MNNPGAESNYLYRVLVLSRWLHYLGQVTQCSMPQFPHLQKGDATSISLVWSGQGLNETIQNTACHSMYFTVDFTVGQRVGGDPGASFQML